MSTTKQQEEEEEIYAGVDVSKACLNVALRPIPECFELANDQAGIDSLVARLEEARPALVVLETTGGLERPLAAALAAAAIPVASAAHPIHPRSAVRDVCVMILLLCLSRAGSAPCLAARLPP